MGGAKSDLLVTFSRIMRGADDYENKMKVVFSNGGDGIQEYPAEPVSQYSLRPPHEAPVTGYQSEWIQVLQYKLPQGFTFAPEKQADRNFFFRIRTTSDENGNIMSALYGKIYGEIDWAGYLAKKGILMFTYYLNPTPNDCNVEFDPDKNLFGGTQRFAP